MAFEPQNITRQHVIQAAERIQKEEIPLHPSTRWDVIINDIAYPPKDLMRYAHEEMNGEYDWGYGGGTKTNKWLEELGFEVVDKSDKNDPILGLIKKYKENARSAGIDEELYKWRLVEKFNGRPDTNVPDFTKEFKSIDFANLIYHNGKAAAYQILDVKPEEFREAFKYLFDEGVELSKRISYFNEETLKIYREINPETKYSHHQDERTIATYLAFHNSSKYAFYKDSFYQKYCKLIGIKPEKKGNKLVHYLALLDDFIDNYILEDAELLDIKKQSLTGDCYEDPNHKIFAQDILYSTLDVQKESVRKYWRVGTSDGVTSFWDVMKDQEHISIGWSNIGDLGQLENPKRKDIIRLLNNENLYTEDKKTASRKAGEILNFYNDIQEGDIILAQDGSDILGVGEVIGEYYYDSTKSFSHCKPVEWKLFSPSIKNTQGLRTTVYQVTQLDVIHQIDNLLIASNIEINMANTNELNQILFGPPGTGKTYNTINKALEIFGADLTGLNRSEIKAIFEKKVDEKSIVFTTFHQSMTYEDFVEGIKPVEPANEGDPVIYRVEEGIFKKLCIEASFSIANEDSSATETVLDFSLAFDNFVQEIEDKLASEEEMTLATKNGGKVLVDGISQQGNIIIKHIGKDNTYPVSKQRLSKLHAAFPDLTAVNNIDQQFRSVIGGSNSTANWSVLNAVRNISPTTPTTSKNKIDSTSWDDKREVVSALNNEVYKGKSGKPFVLIIDEINRGNVSQIFGELITLIETDKRLGNPEALQVQLPYSKDWFGVPPNVHIIGTMNTADRSVEALDTALRRRFSFTEMPPIPELIKSEGRLENGIINGIDLSSLLNVINRRIEKLLDKDHMIGHSYFLSIENLNDLKSAFQNKIIPLLQEYFFGDYGKIGLVIGASFIEMKNNQVEDDFFAPFDNYEISHLMDRKVYHLINVQEMDDEIFVNALNQLERK